MGKLLASPQARLLGRALVAAALSAIVQIHAAGDSTIVWRSVAVGAGLAFLEIVTPLNALVGLGKPGARPPRRTRRPRRPHRARP